MPNNKLIFPMGQAQEWEQYNEIQPEINVTDNTRGTSRDNSTIEVEKDEVILTPNLELFKVKGEKHANGGVPYFAEGGEFIYSDRVRLMGSIIKKYFSEAKLSTLKPDLVERLRSTVKPGKELDISSLNISDDKEYSMADIATKFKTNQDLTNIKEEFSQSTIYKKGASKINLENCMKNLSILSSLQETVKAPRISDNAAFGGTYIMQAGKGWFAMGGEYDVSDEEAQKLKEEGYDFDIL